MPSEDRARVIANNKSLRIIKNELEALAERDAITDEQYDLILQNLPTESSLNSASAASPQPSRANTAASRIPGSVTDAFAALSMNGRSNSSNTQPPSYQATSHTNTTTNNPFPVPLPPRNPPAQQPPAHREVAHVVALYRYADPDPRDLDFEAGDHISVTEYCNAEWGNGINVRTGQEGIFPRNYVRTENGPSSLASGEKVPPAPAAGGFPGAGYQGYQQQGGYPGAGVPPGPSNPYDGPIPPMQVANQPPAEQQPGKGQEMGKKFGKKLGNAAIFGAGATIGSNLVNSIF